MEIAAEDPTLNRSTWDKEPSELSASLNRKIEKIHSRITAGETVYTGDVFELLPDQKDRLESLHFALQRTHQGRDLPYYIAVLALFESPSEAFVTMTNVAAESHAAKQSGVKMFNAFSETTRLYNPPRKLRTASIGMAFY